MPLYCQAAPAQSADDFSSALSSAIRMTSDGSAPAVSCAAVHFAVSSAIFWSSMAARDRRCCILSGVACPAAPDMVQQLWSSSSIMSASIMSPPVRRVSGRLKAGARRLFRSRRSSACAA